tara:strand:+ start:5813 stop:6931 length:1119 start_codon:yes stop_codon:yes gene_type:complete
MKISDEADLVAAVRGGVGAFSVRGGNTRGMAGPGAALSLAGLRGITLYEPGALTLVARAGTPVTEIVSALDAEGQRLAFEPMDHRGVLQRGGEPTIGGVFAANVSGPRRIAVGAARDFLLGVRFVDGRGEVIKNGGRVMKNVTGYDLVKLMAGSFGTLGVLSEVSFKVLPKPETQATLVLHGLEDAAAVAAMTRAMGSPYDVTGAAHDPAAGRTMVRVEGFEASVRYRLGRLRLLLADCGAEMSVLEDAATVECWRAQRDLLAFQGVPGDVWRVSCRPTQGAEIAARAGAEAHLFDWAGGLVWLAMPAGCDLRSRLGSYDGHATLIRADEATLAARGRFEPESAGVARISAGLRARFDPSGLFNAGLMQDVT